MTIFLPLEPTKPVPSSPTFLVASSDPQAQTAKVVKAILKAKRVVIICGAQPSFCLEFCWAGSWLMHGDYAGAGISVKAGIPDFRSPDGLFQTLKRDNPREQLSSGRDLFDASVFNVSAIFRMVAACPPRERPQDKFTCLRTRPVSPRRMLLSTKTHTDNVSPSPSKQPPYFSK